MLFRNRWSRGLRISIAILLATLATIRASQAAELSLATFRVDVTPPIGDGPCVGCMPKVARIEHPLELRGIVLRVGHDTYVISAIDFCGICNSSDDTLRDALAQAAKTTRERVALQSLHQHTAPILDLDAVRLLHGNESQQVAQHLAFTEQIASDATAAIQRALSNLEPVSRIVASMARVDRVASNRRVPQADGSIAVRASLTREITVREAPEGLVDPWLRSVTFLDGERRLAQLHYYATHPQTSYGDARVSWDCVGMARERIEKETGVFQIYFTGCAGNVTVGKYNDGSRAARDELAERLHDAIQRANAAQPAVVVDVSALGPTAIAWSSADIHFSVREEGAFNPDLLRAQLAADQPFATRLTAAMFSGFTQRLRDGYVATATRLRIGDVDLVHLPGEPFVEFQLFAQEHAARNAFVCVAGYGECGVWYYGPDQIYQDRGGYEQTWSVTGPCQESVEDALVELLSR